MSSIQQKQKRSISQNRSSRYAPTRYAVRDNQNLYIDKIEKAQHEQILRQRARRFVARMRKQRQYVGGKHIFKKQLEEKKRQQEQNLMYALMHEKQEMQKSLKMTIVLQKMLINQCQREKKLINELSQQIKTTNKESSDQEFRPSQQQNQIRYSEKQNQSSKRFKTLGSQPINIKPQSLKINYFPPINKSFQQRPAAQKMLNYFKPGHSINSRPKQDKQIYLNKLDQIKLKSIDSKIKKLGKLYNQILN